MEAGTGRLERPGQQVGAVETDGRLVSASQSEALAAGEDSQADLVARRHY